MSVDAIRLLRRSELPVHAEDLARFLIGAAVMCDSAEGRTSARIVETEAYVPGDAAAHSFRGPTGRNRALFLQPGHAYVYFIYGNHWCFNVSAEPAGTGGGVLVRAGEPIAGVELMRVRRGHVADRDLLRGPGRFAQALGIGAEHDGLDLCRPGPMRIGRSSRPRGRIGTSTRIGLSVEIDRKLRFYERGSLVLSGPRGLSP